MNLTAEQVKNLNILADFMDGLDDPRFTMGCYRHDCNTPACAFGWACTIPALQKKGLTWELTEDENCDRVKKGMDFFGGFNNIWHKLFDCSLQYRIKTPQQWAAHCRAFLKDNGYEVSDGFKTFMDRVMVPVDTKETTVAVK